MPHERVPAPHDSILPTDEQALELAERHRESTVRHWRSVATLLEQREELRGVCPLADLIHDAVSWAA